MYIYRKSTSNTFDSATWHFNARFKMNSADGTIHFNLSFSQNSVYLRVRLRERFVNPQLLKQLAVYKIKGTY